MDLPSPRGSLTDLLALALRDPPHALEWIEPDDVEDEQLAMWELQELSFRRFTGVDPRWEEEASLLDVRARLEQRFERDLRRRVAARLPEPEAGRDPAAAVDALRNVITAAEGRSLSAWMAEHATIDHFREFVVHRAAYQLQEADPHSFAIPRLEPSPAKTALLALQWDEYGGHEPGEAHAVLFGRTMRALGLDAQADVDRLPAVTLATNTLLHWLGRSRRLLPACIGHLAVFEMTSVGPMARYSATLRRLLDEPAAREAARFYDVHVAADGLHAEIATDRLVAGFSRLHPDETDEVLFGAAALVEVETRFTEHLLERWTAGHSSLREPLGGSLLRPDHLTPLAG